MSLNDLPLDVIPNGPEHDLAHEIIHAYLRLNDQPALFVAAGYGAKGDATKITGSIGSGTDTYTRDAGTGSFTADDEGKLIEVQGAGAAGVALTTTIAAFISASQVQLAASAATTATSRSTRYGTDDSDAINQAVTDANAAGGGKVMLTRPHYFANVVVKPLVTLEGLAFREIGFAKPSTVGPMLHPPPGTTQAVIRDDGVYAAPFALKNLRVDGDWDTSPLRPLSPDVPQVNGIDLTYAGGQHDPDFVFGAGFYFENVFVMRMNGVGIRSSSTYSECVTHGASVMACKWSGQLFYGTDSQFYHCDFGGNVQTATTTASNPDWLAGLVIYGSNNGFVGGGAWYSGGYPAVGVGTVGAGIVCAGGINGAGSGNFFTNVDCNDNMTYDWAFVDSFSNEIRNGRCGGAYLGCLLLKSSAGACKHHDVDLYLRGSDRFKPLSGVTLDGGAVYHNTVSFNLDFDATDAFGAGDVVDAAYQHIVLANGATV